MNVDGLENARIVLYIDDIPVEEFDWNDEMEQAAIALVKRHRERGTNAWWAIVGEE